MGNNGKEENYMNLKKIKENSKLKYLMENIGMEKYMILMVI